MGQQFNKVTLRIANKMEFLPLVMGNTAIVSKMLGFNDHIIKKIQLGLEEGVSYTIMCGFLPGELDWIDIIYERSVLGLKITIKVKGVPLDVAQVEEEAEFKSGIEKDIAGSGLSLHLIKKCFDQVAFYNLGVEGQEIQLEKYFCKSRTRLKISQDSKPKAMVQSAATAEYIIRPLKMNEAVEVAKCAYSSYGYTYTYEHIYYPERIRDLNRGGKLISYVAITAGTTQEIIGHVALVKGKDYQSMELGVAFVKPAYRGKGCLNKLTETMIEVARKRGLECIYVLAVTTHNISQKAACRMGFRETALLLSRVPRIKMKNINENNICRESVLISSLYLQNVERKPMFPPLHHRQMIERIYQQAGVTNTVYIPDLHNTGGDSSAKQVVIDTCTDKYQTSHIYVNSYGANAKQEVSKTLKKLCLNRMETVYLYLDLTVKETNVMTSEFESLGFFFAGVFPGGRGKDWMILQYLNNQCLDYQQINTYSELGQALVQYVKKCDPYSKK